MKKKMAIASAVTTLALAGALSVVGGSAAFACSTDHMCAYNNNSYGGGALIDTTYTGTGLIDVADGAVSSIKNVRSSGAYDGCGILLPNVFTLIFTAQAASNYPSLGFNVNDKIEHFYYNANRC